MAKPIFTIELPVFGTKEESAADLLAAKIEYQSQMPDYHVIVVRAVTGSTKFKAFYPPYPDDEFGFPFDDDENDEPPIKSGKILN